MLAASTFTKGSSTVRRFEVRDEHDNVFERVRREVDLHKFFPFSEDAREFDRYWLDHCVNPEHPDQKMSLLVFADGCRCQACGFKADAVDIYQMSHPELNKYQCAVVLLENDELVLDRSSIQAKPREVRKLDQDLAVRYHLALAMNQEAFDGLKAFGFTAESIRHFKLGWARVLVRLAPDEEGQASTAPDIEWREINGKKTSFQWQWRYSVPVYEGGVLRQVVYRKSAQYTLGPKTTMEYQAGTWLYNKDALKGVEFVVIGSGWGDVVVMHQWGIPAVCSIAGDGHFKKEWYEDVRRVSRVYSVTDADDAGQKFRARLEEEVPWIRHIELPYAVGTKKDVRDFYLDGHTREEFFRLMKMADIKRRWKALKRR